MITKISNIKLSSSQFGIKKSSNKIFKSNANFNVNYLKVAPKIFSIYNLNHFEAKDYFEGNDANLKASISYLFRTFSKNEKYHY